MGRGVWARGGTARGGSARDRGKERPGRGRAPTNARGAGTAVGLRPTRRIGTLGQLHESVPIRLVGRRPWQKVKLANFIA